MRKLSLLLILALVLCSFTMADEIYLSRDGKATSVKIEKDNLNSRNVSSLILNCNVRSMVTEEVKTSQGTFTKLYVPGWQTTNVAGEPELPMLSRIIEVPMGGKVSVKVLSSEKTEDTISTYKIASPLYPKQPSVRRDIKKVDFAYSRSAYAKSYTRAPIVTVEELGMMRASRLVKVNFLPVEYNPAEKRIAFHNNIKVELVIEDANVEKTLQLKSKYASKYFDFTAAKVTYPESLKVRSEKAIGYLIVADAMFEGNAKLEEFVKHKEGLGYVVTVKFFSNATLSSVGDYIKGVYDKSAPTFLLIVGDHEQIPGKKTGQYTDLYYHSTLSGGSSDYIPDMLCGRFSASNAADLEAQIDKTIEYENKKFAKADFLEKYALVAGWDGNWAIKRGYPQIRYAIKYYFNENKKHDAPVLSGPGRNVFLSKGSHQNEDAIIDTINAGVAFFNYTAHGSQTDFSDPRFTFGDIDSLNNKGMYPLVIGNCCLTGSYQRPTCFGEKWLRVKDKGAIGFIGGSNYTYWDEDLWFGVGHCATTSSVNSGNAPDKADTGIGMYEVGFGEFDNTIPFKISCNAAVMYAGNMAVMASSSSRKQYYWEVYHLFGDPSLPAYWANK